MPAAVVPFLTPPLLLAAILTLLPLLTAAFCGERLAARAQTLPLWLRIAAPVALCLPYLLITASTNTLHWNWLLLYALLPVVVAALLHDARRVDPTQRGTWRDLLVLLTLGLAVDLRWFEPAWPPHLAVFNKILLLDTGLYGFLVMRRLDGVGFDLRLRLRDLHIGLREFACYTPIAITLGLGLGFLHLHTAPSQWPHAAKLAGMFLFTFLFIAVPEELFFRGWVQNLLERRLGRTPALLVTAVLFGLSHFNKRALHFNWRYVVLAAIAGIFYGRAWRQDRRVGASALTHAGVDTVWSAWLR
jgi:membrane protease YdiL (CAAX protease family)